MPELILYSSRYCPFCMKVLRYLRSESISVKIKDTMENPSARQELASATGRTQVPCLFIDGNPLFESNDIIQWFKENYND